MTRVMDSESEEEITKHEENLKSYYDGFTEDDKSAIKEMRTMKLKGFDKRKAELKGAGE
jgi:hypothetical protein